MRDIAKAMGKLTKADAIDAIDAQVLREFAARVQPEPRALPDEAALLLQALLRRRTQLTEMLMVERSRMRLSPKALHKQLQAHIEWLGKQLKDFDKNIAQHIEQSPLWRDKDQPLQSVPGIGSQVSRVLLVTPNTMLRTQRPWNPYLQTSTAR